MADFPLPLVALLGDWGAYGVYLVVGLCFGYVLESAGFGNSTKLAAQFYGKDMTVFKVMFTAIIVAMTLIFLSSALGLLDYNLIWVPPTYLWPGILGGLIMGVGFIIGGFCPGTSLVAMATGKLDGIVFVFGVLFGIFLFGETVAYFDVFFNSSYMGRFTLPELFDVSTGTVVITIVIAAVCLFIGAEKLERWVNNIQGNPPSSTQIPGSEAKRWAVPGAFTVIFLSLLTNFWGQPTAQDRWEKVKPQLQQAIEERQIYVSPHELLSTIYDPTIRVITYDVRDESSYNQFHLSNSKRLMAEDIESEAKVLQLEPANTVIMLVSNDDEQATAVWKQLKAASVQNVYVLDGGVNHWLETFAQPGELHKVVPRKANELAFEFYRAIGDRHPAASPNQDAYNLIFNKKIRLELKRAPTSGGCS
jgi:rhodanese-related sulfurtransferase